MDNGNLVICLQALERAIEYNEFLSQSKTVDKDDYEEINYCYELTLNKLAKKYVEESKKDESLLPISKIIKYEIVE
jgi:hypothetical protein